MKNTMIIIHQRLIKLGIILPCIALLNVITVKAIQMPPAVVKIEKIKKADYAQENKYIGRIEAIESVSLKPRVEAAIKKINFVEGAFVKKNDLLIQFEDVKYKAQALAYKAKVAMAQAKLVQYENAVIFAQKNLNRQESLQRKKVVAMKLLEDAQLKFKIANAQYSEAQASVDEANANFKEAENLLSYTKIYAPITGMIGQVSATFGNIVDSQSPSLAQIVQLDPIRVKFSVSETDFLSMFGSDQGFKKNAKIIILLADGSKYIHEATPDFIDNKVDSDTNTIKIWAKLKNDKLTLKPGSFVTAYLSSKSSKNYLKFPINALRTDREGYFIYTVNKKGAPIKKHVSVSGASAGLIFIEKGDLNAGDPIITEGMHKINPFVKQVMTRDQFLKMMTAKKNGTKPTKDIKKKHERSKTKIKNKFKE